MSEVRTPFEAFRDTDGTPLDAGYVYIGVENQEPITHPASVFWDADLTIAATQPIRTIGGYPVRAGAPAKVYASGGYSICVKNKNGEIIVSAVSSGSLEALLADATSASRGAGMIGYGPGVTYPAGTIGDALASIPSAYVTYAADQAQTYRAFTASGTAPAFTLTPSPAVTALAEPMEFEVKFSANGTVGSNTLNVSALGAVALKQYDPTGTLVDGVIKSGQIAKVRYNGTYWVILNPLPSATASGGNYSCNLKAIASGTDAVVTITADDLVLRASGQAAQLLTDVSQTIAMNTNGAGGLDTGTVAASTWYYGYIIAKADGTRSAVASLSSTGPTVMPSGYVVWSLATAFITDATANKYPMSYLKRGRLSTYVVAAGSNVAAQRVAVSGVQNTQTQVSLANFVPPTATAALLIAITDATTNGSVDIYSNSSPNSLVHYHANGHDLAHNANVLLNLEAQSFYYQSYNGTPSVQVYGWFDPF